MQISIGFLGFILIFALLCGIALGFLGGRLHTAQASAHLQRQLQASQQEQILLNGKLEQLEIEKRSLEARTKADSGVVQRLEPIYEQLREVSQRVHSLNEYTATQDAKMLKQLEISAQTNNEIFRTANALQSALQSNSARGNWGEIQLRRIIEAAGMLEHVDFAAQKSSGNFTSSAQAGKSENSKQRPDVLVHLPGNVHLPIDAKVPLTSYLKAQALPEIGAEAQRNELLAKHVKALRGHIAELKKRNYPGEFPDSPQITVLFLPSEALLSQAVMADAALLEDAMRAGVLLTSPSSLLALLKAVASVWSTAAVNAEAKEIVELGRTLIERLATMAEHLQKLGSYLGKSVKLYNNAVASLEKRVLITAREFSSLEDSTAKLPDYLPRITGEKSQTRLINMDEFLPPESQ
ncbi:DNA recombination protein RmuC [uncultured Arcanobacterium sp.]|uniref:DNA recombination protein RmuC n=1 Tax=uncultured Arcanobacterium sp. TaxID=487520 RepID=UPI0026345C20|nr:DNA recombination protein RmuC [uncultured Arcanobacterium sp.]